MKSLVIVLNKTEYLDDILDTFLKFNVKGATIVDSQGMGAAVLSSESNNMPLFGSLRKILGDVKPYSKTIFSVIKEEIIEQLVEAIKSIFHKEKRKGVVFMFTVPVDNLYLLDN